MLATGGNQTVEIINVQDPESTDCQTSLPDFPVDVEDAVAKIYNNTPWICGGGAVKDDSFSDKCFSLDVANNKWINQSSLQFSRAQSAAALIQNGTNGAEVN